jgi:GT2 family glycosyltransferase
VEDYPPVSIIILNWNKKAFLEKCLMSIKEKTSYPNFTTVVVDNGSSDGSANLVKGHFSWVDVLELNENCGFSVGNNIGINYVLSKYNPKYVMLLNNDTEITQVDWLKKLVYAAQSDIPRVGVVGCQLIYPDGKPQSTGNKLTVGGGEDPYPNGASRPETYEVDTVTGACFLINCEVIKKIGFFDTGFSPFNEEESDFCMRTKKIGYKVIVVSSVKVIHFCGASMKTVNSVYVHFVGRRNTIRFMLLNFPSSWLVKRVPYELLLFLRCFITKPNAVNNSLPIALRPSRDAFLDFRINIEAWLYNLERLPDILQKRWNRTMRILP